MTDLRLVRSNGVIRAPGDLDPFDTRVPDGQYEVAYLAEERARSFGRTYWAVRFLIVEEGDHFQKPLLRFYNLPPKTRRPRRSSTLATDYVMAVERKPPPHLYSMRPSEFLKGCQFLARVVSVLHDRNGVQVPEAARYSRIKALIQRTAGTPQVLRKEPRPRP